MQRLRDAFDSFCEHLKGWKTVLFGVALAMSGFVLELLVFFQGFDLSALFSPRSAVVANIVIGLLVIVLRWRTTGPIGEKGSE